MAVVIFIASLALLIFRLSNKEITLVPLRGGEFKEGIVGQPTFVNPVMANNEADQDLSAILFDSIEEISESQKVSEDGKTWNVRLKGNVLWHDRQPLISDDVIFTINTIQNVDVGSPLFTSWQGVLTKRISEREVEITLPTSYYYFKNTLDELRPIPKHIFENIPASNFRLSNYNLEPIGSGPFKFVSFKKKRNGFITEYKLTRNNDYYKNESYLDRFYIKFFQTDQDLIDSFNKGVIDGFIEQKAEYLKEIKIVNKTFDILSPRYYAVFLNNNTNSLLSDINIRKAINYAVNRESIIENILDNHAIVITGPLLPNMEGYSSEINNSSFSSNEAKNILENNGWTIGEDGIREKQSRNEPIRLEFTIVVPPIQHLVETANEIQTNLAEAGIKINLIIPSEEEINSVITTRNYEMLLFGNIFGSNPDLFSFWHSSERFYPGLNLSLYKNSQVDTLLESTRKSFDENERKMNLTEIQKNIQNNTPAIFLYSPNYFYIAKQKLLGFEYKYLSSPSNRFDDIENWYIKAKKIYK